MSGQSTIRIATRRSQLAQAQCRWVGEQLKAARPGLSVELVPIVTSGDRIQDRVLREVGGKGLFVKEIEEALLEGRADLAVHSLKDVPAELPPGLGIIAIPEREDPRDVLVVARPVESLDELPRGARVGTASLRRTALLKRWRSDLVVLPLRGNVPTRLRKLTEGELDAIVLAEAGLRRLGLTEVARIPLDPVRFIPAGGQGALALEARRDRSDLAWVTDALEHLPTRLAVEAERAFLGRVGGSCQVPVGAFARWDGDALRLTGCVADPDGDVVERSLWLEGGQLVAGLNPERAAELGLELAEQVLLGGGSTLVALFEGAGPSEESDEDTSIEAPSGTPGTVYLVGAGPGERGLITVRGERLLASADAVVYDYLANDDLLSAIHPSAERHFVGKRAGRHQRSQGEISGLLVELARRHQVVIRLKGGDPFVFGRGGEEAEALVEAGISFEVVPGITSAIAAPAFAGVPLTHRGTAGSVVFLTGHSAKTAPSEVDWAAVAGIDTVVILMGTGRVRQNMEALMAGGRPANDLALAIEWASYPRQRTVAATVSTLADRMANEDLVPPTVIVVGEVAGLHNRLAWFSQRPLFGKRILVTRSESQASRLSTLLFQVGAVPIEVPALAIRPVSGPERRRLDAALTALGRYDWVVFTSHNGVVHSFARLRELGLDARALAGRRAAVIGTATGDVLRQHGITPDLVPERFDAEGLLAELGAAAGSGGSVLLLRAREARATLVEGLQARGVRVDDVAAYSSEAPVDLPESLARVLAQPIDLITVASTKTVKNLAAAAGQNLDRLLDVPAACIGPVTRRAASRLGFDVVVQPERFTIDGLVEAIARWAERQTGRAGP